QGFDLDIAHRLYKTVFGPIERHIAGKKHLILVPNGPLTSLPLQVLITRKPQPQATPEDTVRNADWLIRNYALSVLPSVQSLASLRRLQRVAQSRKPFIGIGDPILKGGQQGTSRGAKRANLTAAKYYTRGLADVRAVSAMTPLPDTADELRAIGRVLGAQQDDILLQNVASETSVKSRKLDDYRIVHFATHGLVAGDLTGLNEPALVLTPPQQATKKDDGLLTASEIATLSLDADWVVLSACNTASGSTVGAEALSGLARAFFFSGARALLVSHWAVYSDAAVKLTTRTFAAMKRNPDLGRAEAFRQSMLTLIKEGRPPAYWAPFVIVGEGGRAG
ncbi:MAG: CHAT domain-containing protein, partial [Pseudomonadota bacterium]